MEYLFLLNGDHEKLARLEIESLLEAYGIGFRLTCIGKQTILVDADEMPRPLLSRLALTHRAMVFLGKFSPSTGDIPKAPIQNSYTEGSFRVRIKKIDKGINSMDEERRISEGIISATKGRVDLRDPDQEFYGIYLGDHIYLGYTLFVNDPKAFSCRKPQFRPYFHPSSIDPRIARAMVNLSEAMDEVMDPFCGTGGILIEAGLMGLSVHGIDIEKKMTEGARRNLSFFGIEADIRIDDTSRMDIDRGYEAIVTDVPYGKSTVIGQDRDSLYGRAFKKIFSMCRNKAVIVLPSEHDFTKYGFVEEGMVVIRVHKSLERHIYKLGKNIAPPMA
ncbi:MAG: N-6 DNA methylase [Candidatus Methanofastidiosa archaeon]|nr:N-6 DNA methylase [Candidatus Methanofastidiosa archaeon]